MSEPTFEEVMQSLGFRKIDRHDLIHENFSELIEHFDTTKPQSEKWTFWGKKHDN